MTDFRLKLRSDGMFSNVNEVVEHLHRAKAGGYRFWIDWSASCYRDEGRPGDPWSYYFEPCFADLASGHPDSPVLPGGVPVACAKDNIITPRREDGNCSPLLLPKDRSIPHELINKHIRPLPAVTSIVDAFRDKHFADRDVIGLHIRGAGRADGGVPDRNKLLDLVGGIPLPTYFSAVDAALTSLPAAKIFACSDSSLVIDQIVARYGERVITYDATRSEFGEMHARHPKNSDMTFDKHKLGLDVLVEAYLLGRTTVLIHGNSNVINFVLCDQPKLLHHYIYDY